VQPKNGSLKERPQKKRKQKSTLHENEDVKIGHQILKNEKKARKLFQKRKKRAERSNPAQVKRLPAKLAPTRAPKHQREKRRKRDQDEDLFVDVFEFQ